MGSSHLPGQAPLVGFRRWGCFVGSRVARWTRATSLVAYVSSHRPLIVVEVFSQSRARYSPIVGETRGTAFGHGKSRGTARLLAEPAVQRVDTIIFHEDSYTFWMGRGRILHFRI